MRVRTIFLCEVNIFSAVGCTRVTHDPSHRTVTYTTAYEILRGWFQSISSPPSTNFSPPACLQLGSSTSRLAFHLPARYLRPSNLPFICHLDRSIGSNRLEESEEGWRGRRFESTIRNACSSNISSASPPSISKSALLRSAAFSSIERLR